MQNRVTEIRAKVPPSNWFYVRSKGNPADIGTRIASNLSWLNSDLWWHAIFDQSLIEDAHSNGIQANLDEEMVRVKNFNVSEPVVESQRFSQYNRLIRSFWFVRRFCQLSTCEFEFKREEMALIRVCQNESFHNEIHLLKNNSVIHKSSPIYNLKPFLDANGT